MSGTVYADYYIDHEQMVDGFRIGVGEANLKIRRWGTIASGSDQSFPNSVDDRVLMECKKLHHSTCANILVVNNSSWFIILHSFVL